MTGLATILLPTTAPYNLQATVRLLQRRPTNRVDRWEGGAYQRALATVNGPRLVEVANRGPVLQPQLQLTVHGGSLTDESSAALVTTTRLILGLDAPPAPASLFEAAEPALAPVLQALHGFRTPCFPTLFETFASVLPFQQLSLDAGVAIVGRLVDRFGERIAVGGREFAVFPAPEAVASARTEDLRATGLSQRKAEALRALAQLVSEGAISREHVAALPTADARAELQNLPGVGPWTASVILLRGFRRLDVFPGGDVGAARNLTELLQPPEPFTPATASDFAARFGDQRGYLYFLALGQQLRARGLLDPTGGSGV